MIDPINAMLNYGYAVLSGRVKYSIMRAGLDPAVGFMPMAASVTSNPIPAASAARLSFSPSRALIQRREVEFRIGGAPVTMQPHILYIAKDGNVSARQILFQAHGPVREYRRLAYNRKICRVRTPQR